MTPDVAPTPLFGRATLQRHVDEVLGSLPEGKKGVILAVSAGNGWVELVTLVKIDDHWQLEGRLRHERESGTTGTVQIRSVW